MGKETSGKIKLSENGSKVYEKMSPFDERDCLLFAVVLDTSEF